MKINFFIISFFILILYSGCNPKYKSIILYDKDSGGSYNLNKGDTLKIILESNPSTGYQWKRAIIDTSRFKHMDKTYTADKTRPGIVGSGGKSAFRFIAAEKGKGRIKLIYKRPFEKEKLPAREFEVRFNIK